jgi:hypothetical protein
VKAPGSVIFYPDEIKRIEDAELILLGVPPRDLEHMSLQQRSDVLAISEAKYTLAHGKMPGQKLTVH